MLSEHDESIEVKFVLRKDTLNTEDWVEICLQNEAPMFNPLATSSAPTASAVKGTEQYTDGTAGVDLYQVGLYGSALSCLRSKFICAMEGSYQSKAAPHLKKCESLSRSWTCESNTLS